MFNAPRGFPGHILRFQLALFCSLWFVPLHPWSSLLADSLSRLGLGLESPRNLFFLACKRKTSWDPCSLSVLKRSAFVPVSSFLLFPSPFRLYLLDSVSVCWVEGFLSPYLSGWSPCQLSPVGLLAAYLVVISEMLSKFSLNALVALPLLGSVALASPSRM